MITDFKLFEHKTDASNLLNKIYFVEHETKYEIRNRKHYEVIIDDLLAELYNDELNKFKQIKKFKI